MWQRKHNKHNIKRVGGKKNGDDTRHIPNNGSVLLWYTILLLVNALTTKRRIRPNISTLHTTMEQRIKKKTMRCELFKSCDNCNWGSYSGNHTGNLEVCKHSKRNPEHNLDDDYWEARK